jgi:hypothetical protein
VKLHLGRRLLRQVEKQEAWWGENRPAAPDLFAREFRDTLAIIRATPGAGVLMPKTQNHVYFRVDEGRKVIHVVGVWGTPKGRGPKL